SLSCPVLPRPPLTSTLFPYTTLFRSHSSITRFHRRRSVSCNVHWNLNVWIFCCCNDRLRDWIFFYINSWYISPALNYTKVLFYQFFSLIKLYITCNN